MKLTECLVYSLEVHKSGDNTKGSKYPYFLLPKYGLQDVSKLCLFAPSGSSCLDNNAISVSWLGVLDCDLKTCPPAIMLSLPIKKNQTYLLDLVNAVQLAVPGPQK